MVGNTYSYTPAIWADDIAKASANGIDGFALNMGRDEWEPARIADAYAAAEAKGNFKLFFSLDVSSLGCSTTAHAANLANIILTYANSSAQALYKDKVLVSSFAGENCNFGQSSVTAGWAYTKDLLTAQNTSIYLMPAIFSDPAGFKALDWMDGEFNWNGAWPMTAAPLTTASDEQYMSALGTKGYMPAMSPAFFTYYGANSYNKNWIYRSDDWLLATRMEQIIAMRNKVDMVEIISWNDYGESHYIGPIRADQPNSQGWTDGMDHQGWLSIIKLYSTAFKTGSYPTNTDTITLWSRPHPKAATATAPSNPRPSGWQNTDDNLYAFITINAPATIIVTSGSNTVTWPGVKTGINKFSVGNSPGPISAKITRNGVTIKEYNSGSAFQYTDTPADYNFNYFVGQA